MQRIQKVLIVLSAISCLLAAGCKSDLPDILTVADYMHDIDAAKARLHVAKQVSSTNIDLEVSNASQAVANVMDPKYLKCWPTKPVITANTDHACLDSLGFSR